MSSLHSRVLDDLGTEICSGARVPGSALTLDDIERTFAVSRSVARESVRVLEALGIVTSRPRVGVVVRPESSWNAFDPRVIRWRMLGAERERHVRSLAELRLAIEPEAARRAAERADPDLASELVGLAGQMWAAHEQQDAARFHDLDVTFHARLLAASGNPLFAQLDSVVGEALVGRHSHELDPEHPTAGSARLHTAVAAAIQQHDGDGASLRMRELLLMSGEETAFGREI